VTLSLRRVVRLFPSFLADFSFLGALPFSNRYVLLPTVETKKSAAYKADPDAFRDDEEATGSDTEDEDEIKQEKEIDPYFIGRQKEAEQGKRDFGEDEWLAKAEPGLNRPYQREVVKPKEYDPDEGDSVQGDSEEDVSFWFPSFTSSSSL